MYSWREKTAVTDNTTKIRESNAHRRVCSDINILTKTQSLMHKKAGLTMFFFLCNRKLKRAINFKFQLHKHKRRIEHRRLLGMQTANRLGSATLSCTFRLAVCITRRGTIRINVALDFFKYDFLANFLNIQAKAFLKKTLKFFDDCRY